MPGAWILLKKKTPAFTVVDGSLFYIWVTASQKGYYMVNEDTKLEYIKNLVSVSVYLVLHLFSVFYWVRYFKFSLGKV